MSGDVGLWCLDVVEDGFLVKVCVCGGGGGMCVCVGGGYQALWYTNGGLGGAGDSTCHKYFALNYTFFA